MLLISNKFCTVVGRLQGCYVTYPHWRGGVGPEISLRSITRERVSGWALEIEGFFGPVGSNMYIKLPTFYTALYVMVFDECIFIIWASGRGLGPGISRA